MFDRLKSKMQTRIQNIFNARAYRKNLKLHKHIADFSLFDKKKSYQKALDMIDNNYDVTTKDTHGQCAVTLCIKQISYNATDKEKERKVLNIIQKLLEKGAILTPENMHYLGFYFSTYIPEITKIFQTALDKNGLDLKITERQGLTILDKTITACWWRNETPPWDLAHNMIDKGAKLNRIKAVTALIGNPFNTDASIALAQKIMLTPNIDTTSFAKAPATQQFELFENLIKNYQRTENKAVLDITKEVFKKNINIHAQNAMGRDVLTQMRKNAGFSRSKKLKPIRDLFIAKDQLEKSKTKSQKSQPKP